MAKQKLIFTQAVAPVMPSEETKVRGIRATKLCNFLLILSLGEDHQGDRLRSGEFLNDVVCRRDLTNHFRRCCITDGFHSSSMSDILEATLDLLSSSIRSFRFHDTTGADVLTSI
jgi:hypothetical protein